MRKINTLIVCMLMGISASAYAETVVETTEVGVPIVVEGDSYVVESHPSYYYYQGHRCYVEKKKDVVNFLGYKAKVSGGSEIYCYPYP